MMVKCSIFHKTKLLSGFKLPPPVLQSVNPKESGDFYLKKYWNWHHFGQESSLSDRTKFAVIVADSCKKVAIPPKLNLKLKSESEAKSHHSLGWLVNDVC